MTGNFSRTALFFCLMAGGVALLLPLSASAQKVYTVAGGYVGDGGLATSASFETPWDAVYDLQGNLLITDSRDCRIRRLDTNGNISTMAGTGICGFSGDGGPATKAKIFHPLGIAMDSNGNIFYVDDNRIRKITSAGIITTIAGSSKNGFCGDGGPPLKACFSGPTALALGEHGSDEVVYVADSSNHRIRRITLGTNSKVTTFAGDGSWGDTGDGGPAKKAGIGYPEGVAFSASAHSVWIGDSNNGVIRVVDTATNIINTLVLGNCDPLCLPEGIHLDANGYLHVGDLSWVERVSVSDGAVTLEAGVFLGQGFNGDGLPATKTLFGQTTDAVVSPKGELTTVDLINARVRRGSDSENVTTIAGGYIGDGHPATRASLNSPRTVAFDLNGNAYTVDSYNYRIRRVSANGVISTFAGTGISGYSGDGGPAKKATLFYPLSVATDLSGDVFIGDYHGTLIRKVDAHGTINTFYNSGSAQFDTLATDSAGNVYAADEYGPVIWKITPDGNGTIIAGVEGQFGYNGDGIPATQAYLQNPFGVALDADGNLYIGDSLNNRVRKVDQDGIISTIAGNGTCGFSGDGGSGTDAMLCGPQGVATDTSGNVYFTDTQNARVRVVDSSGIIHTYAGTGKYGYNGNGLPALKTNMYPWSVTVGPKGIVYVVDTDSVRVRKIQ